MNVYNDFNNFNNKKRIGMQTKKSKSSNRTLKNKMELPTLKDAINKEKNYLRNGYLEIINQNIGKKKNNSQLHSHVQKNHKPYSGNPLKFHNKKELNNINNKYSSEREIFTANPYLAGYNVKKKNYFRKFNYNNNVFNNFSINPAYNNNILKNKIVYNNEKNIINNIFFDKNKNKLRGANRPKPNNNSNKIIIVASNNENNKSNDYKNDKELINNASNNQEIDQNSNLQEKHIDLYFISYSYSENPNLEHRKEMEDFHYIKAVLNKKLCCSYFGLFDGHSGKEVGMYLMENLHKVISQEIKSNNVENSENMKIIIKNSFEKIDQEINSQNFKNETGSTGTVLLLYKDIDSKTGKSLLCANVGDSKAYLIKKNEIKIITKDHKCSDAEEVKRIRDTGGIVFRERVFGTLMLTRSFGDKEMKKYGVLSTPDIFCQNIEEDDLFVIIASDGVWDVVEEDEVFKFAQDKISSNELSKKIIDLAKERDTHDNISCIVVKLNKNNN